MRKLLFLIIAIACWWPLSAQPDINMAEYFFDLDPGVENGTALTLAGPGISLDEGFNISTTGLLPGFHTLNIRVRNADLSWAPYETRTFYIQNAGEIQGPLANLERMEYFFDTDEGIGVSTVVVDFVDGVSIDEMFDIATAGLTPGFHILNVRVQDANGAWSPYETRTFYLQSTGEGQGPLFNIVELEYFLDADPGTGLGTILDLTDGLNIDDQFDVTLTSVPQGFHVLNVRVRDANGAWSPFETRTFYVQTISAVAENAPIVSYEYFIGADTGPGTGTVVGVTPALSIEESIMIELTGLGLIEGDYSLTFRVKDENGAWSPSETRPFSVCNSAETFYADNDGDGFGDLNSPITACEQPAGYVTNSDDCDDTDINITNQDVTWYLDNDGDGYGDPLTFVLDCLAPAGYVNNGEDCDDTDINVNPDTIWYADNDGDGFGNPGSTTTACEQPAGFVADNTDCNDNDIDINPDTVWYIDGDMDGFGDPATSLTSCDQPVGYVNNDTDCDDTDNTILAEQIWYADSDGDGYGDPGNFQTSCAIIANHVTNSLDCDDTDDTINPDGTDVAGSGVDANCDGQYVWYVDGDVDTYGSTATISSSNATAGAGESATADDCNDANATLNPGATDVAGSGIDANCDGEYLWYVDIDGDGYGSLTTISSTNATAGTGESATGDDCNDADATLNPGATDLAGSGIDANCDGQYLWYADTDGDGFGSSDTVSSANSTASSGESATSDDCDDGESTINPSGADIAGSGIDANCDGEYLWYVDSDGDGFAGETTASSANASPGSGEYAESTDCDDTNADLNPNTTWYADTDGDGFGDEANSTFACTQPTGFVLISGDCSDDNLDVYPGAPAMPDGLDNNCDGTVDKVSQTLTLETVSDQQDDGSTIELTASATSNLDVAFTVEGPATIAGTTLTLTGAGNVTVTANQAGDDGYEEATAESISFCVNPLPAITIEGEGTAVLTLTSNYGAGNNWQLDGTAISGAINSSLEVTQEGTYSVLVDIDGCVGESADFEAILTGFEDMLSSEMSLYPNPVNQVLNYELKSNMGEDVQIRIVDMQGKVYLKDVSNQSGGSLSGSLDVSSLTPGMYILMIQSGEAVEIQRFEKQ